MRNDLTKINKEQGLYVLKAGNGYSCLGFDVCEDISKRIQAELNIFDKLPRKGTKKHYAHYLELCEKVRQLNELNGFRSSAWLNPLLIGLEHKRVEVTYSWGEKERFYVGKSTGFMPCHIAVKQSNSTGGAGITYKDDIKVKVIS